MHELSVTLVIGTRPEAIKMAPVLHALRQRRLSVHLLLTGQHPLEPAEFGLDAVPITRLSWPSTTVPHRAVDLAAAAIVPGIGWTDLVLVQGDTSSALAGARAAQQRGIAIGHVEAGLRSHDPLRPWPEEEFRVEIDRIAALLFAPTELSAANLRREGVRGEVHVTGNTAIDALLAKPCPTPFATAARRVLVTCHRRESWGAGLDRVAAAVRRIAASGRAEVRFVLHPNARVAAQMQSLLGGVKGIELTPPCAHEEILAAMREADLVLSDSGGMQEEAASLGVPLLILRDATERPEGLVSGNLKLVGTDPERIVRTGNRLLSRPDLLASMRAEARPYGDGKAAQRIAAIVAERLSVGRGEKAAPAAVAGYPNQDRA